MFVVNILVLVYRIVAAVDAWQVARFLNAVGRLRRRPPRPGAAARSARCRSPACSPSCSSSPAATSPSRATTCSRSTSSTACSPTSERRRLRDAADRRPPPRPGRRRRRSTRRVRGRPPPARRAAPPTPDRHAPHGHARPHPAAVGRQGAAQHPARSASTSARATASFNTDTLIVVSIDPETKQVAMFQVPRDMVDVPVPANARSRLGQRLPAARSTAGSRQNRNRTDLWPRQDRPGPRLQRRSRRILGRALRPRHPLLRDGQLRGLPRRREHPGRRPGQRPDPGRREPLPAPAAAPHADLHPGRPAAHDRRRGARSTPGRATARGRRLRPRAAPAARPALARASR